HEVIQKSVHFPRIEQRKDVRMPEVCCIGDLAEESHVTEGGREVGAQNLERDRSIVLEIVREIHRRHAAGAELTLDTITIGECGGESVNRSVHLAFAVRRPMSGRQLRTTTSGCTPGRSTRLAKRKRSPAGV